jgi:hypothetical protein
VCKAIFQVGSDVERSLIRRGDFRCRPRNGSRRPSRSLTKLMEAPGTPPVEPSIGPVVTLGADRDHRASATCRETVRKPTKVFRLRNCHSSEGGKRFTPVRQTAGSGYNGDGWSG